MFSILVVCTANICRSPTAAGWLRRELTPPDRLTAGIVQVESAGVAALPGLPACDLSAAILGGEPTPGGSSEQTHSHRSRPLTAAMAEQADLVLALDRTHRAELARLAPAARPRTFTLRQAAQLADQVAGSLNAGSLPPGAGAPPVDPQARLRWWVDELDAARGPALAEGEPDSLGWHVLDVPDPHVLGYQIHAPALELAQAACRSLTTAMFGVLEFADDPVPPAPA